MGIFCCWTSALCFAAALVKAGAAPVSGSIHRYRRKLSERLTNVLAGRLLERMLSIWVLLGDRCRVLYF